MSKKFKFRLDGIEFQLPIKFIKKTDWNGNPITPEININHVAGASVIKQYVKKKYPSVVVSSSSASFSMGNSVDIYLSDERGAGIDEAIYKDVSAFGNMFRYGSFNGMIDMYEMKEGDNPKSESGTTLQCGCKFVHVQNKPKFCSVPDIYKMLYDMTQTTNYVMGKLSLDKAIEHVKGYGATDTQIQKALQLVNY